MSAGRFCLHTRDDVVRLARAWVGTPYHHQASVRGLGTDCLGLVRGVWRELCGREAEIVGTYSRDWAEATGRESLLDEARRQLIEIDARAAGPGDILVFRLRKGSVAKHAAIMTTETAMVHAMEGGSAAEVAIGPWWRRRIAGAFSFPEVGSSPCGRV